MCFSICVRPFSLQSDYHEHQPLRMKWGPTNEKYHNHSSWNEKSLGRLILKLIVDGPLSKESHNSILATSIAAGHPERPYHALGKSQERYLDSPI